MEHKNFYAVVKGRNPGIYNTWEECKSNINGYSGALYKKYNTYSEAAQAVRVVSIYNTNIEVVNNPKNIIFTGKEVTHSEDIVIKPILDCKDKKISDIHGSRTLVAFTDGSSKDNGSSNSKAGCGVYFPLRDEVVSKSLPRGSTNNYAEYSALLLAWELFINYNDLYDDLVVYTDSELLVKTVNIWMYKWQKSSWKLKGNKDIANIEIIKSIYKIKELGKLSVIHIRAHTEKEDEWSVANDRVDKIAKEAADKS